MTLTKQEILNYLELVNSELTDAYNTGSTESENSDSLYFIDTARDLVDELTTRLEDPQEEPVPTRTWIEKVDLWVLMDFH